MNLIQTAWSIWCTVSSWDHINCISYFIGLLIEADFQFSEKNKDTPYLNWFLDLIKTGWFGAPMQAGLISCLFRLCVHPCLGREYIIAITSQFWFNLKFIDVHESWCYVMYFVILLMPRKPFSASLNSQTPSLPSLYQSHLSDLESFFLHEFYYFFSKTQD